MRAARVLYVYEERIPEDLRSLVRSKLSVIDGLDLRQMTYRSEEKQQRELLSWADVTLFAPGRYLSPELLECAKGQKLMQLWSSGYDKFNCEDARKNGIPVANNGGANAISVAEHTLLLMLSVSKWLPDSHQRTIGGRWSGGRHGLDMSTLQGKVLGIVGFGNIGRAVAVRAAAFDMQVLYVDIVKAPEEVELMTSAARVSLDEALVRSDYLSLHVHADEKTKGMLGRSELSKLKDGAVLINVSRASLVDYQLLLEFLASGKLGGVGLDVYPEEPTSAGDPLLTHPKVVATPHTGGSTRDAIVRSLDNCVINLQRGLLGETPLWIVNGVGQ